jgi:hypothetical protein
MMMMQPRNTAQHLTDAPYVAVTEMQHKYSKVVRGEKNHHTSGTLHTWWGKAYRVWESRAQCSGGQFFVYYDFVAFSEKPDFSKLSRLPSLVFDHFIAEYETDVLNEQFRIATKQSFVETLKSALASVEKDLGPLFRGSPALLSDVQKTDTYEQDRLVGRNEDNPHRQDKSKKSGGTANHWRQAYTLFGLADCPVGDFGLFRKMHLFLAGNSVPDAKRLIQFPANVIRAAILYCTTELEKMESGLERLQRLLTAIKTVHGVEVQNDERGMMSGNVAITEDVASSTEDSTQ